MELVLASASPRRASLLRESGVEFALRPVDIDESWRAGESPVAYTRRLAEAKARAAARPGELALAADTTVWFREDEAPLGKPVDRAEARAMLQRLSAGAPHFVTTAWALAGEDALRVEHETTRVHMRKLDADQIERHLERETWADKAGGYAIQGASAGLVTRIEGSYTNVVGLPLAQVLEALEEARR